MRSYNADNAEARSVISELRSVHQTLVAAYLLIQPKRVDVHGADPSQLHKRHQAAVMDTKESVGHLRAESNEDDSRTLLKPIAFQIERMIRLGSPAVCRAERGLRALRTGLGVWAGWPLLGIALPSVGLATLDPRNPFCLYTKALKLGGAL